MIIFDEVGLAFKQFLGFFDKGSDRRVFGSLVQSFLSLIAGRTNQGQEISLISGKVGGLGIEAGDLDEGEMVLQ